MRAMSLFGKKRIFLDYASGRDNPSSVHEEGIRAKKRLAGARLQIARLFGVQTRDIIFTSGSTEADNLAILGVFEAVKEIGVSKPHIIIGEDEHPAVFESALEVKRRGGDFTISNDPLKHIKKNTVLISMTYANSETGKINPVPKLFRDARTYKKEKGIKFPYLHTDASQALASLPVEPIRLGADLVTLDPSKVGGPKGCGILIVRPGVPIRPVIVGGGQERGLRSGTENLGAILESVNILKKALATRDVESRRLRKLQEFFIRSIERAFPEVVINTPKDSIPNIVSLSFSGKLHEFLAIKLDDMGVAVSTGSSCSSLKNEPDKEALRFSFGKSTNEKDLAKVIRILEETVL